MTHMAANETAMVTGATGAIGEAIASGLAANGLAVVLACRNPAKAKSERRAASAKVTGSTRSSSRKWT